MENRNYVLDRIRSKTKSIDQFNYDKLQAPPISMMFTPQDIWQLNQIARSLKYAAKPEVKYQEIDKIMRSRGFVKFVAGTNRIAYRPLEDNSFLVKVAYDAIGLGDNPREFYNQHIFKPFVTKVFEVTPCGTLGVFERVNPITSRQEFVSVASDIFEVINQWFIGEYVLEDIGTKYFMNWGIRRSFGPVLLDFPYVYKLDGNKLYCNAPNPMSVTGCCEGLIDYDPGYNFLYCTKCGVKYKAKELEEAINNEEVIVKMKGDKGMITRRNKDAVATISGGKLGNKVVQVHTTTGTVVGSGREEYKSMPSREVKGRNNNSANKSNFNKRNNEPAKKVDSIDITKAIHPAPKVDESEKAIVSEAIKVEQTKSTEASKAVINEVAKKESPISFEGDRAEKVSDDLTKFYDAIKTISGILLRNKTGKDRDEMEYQLSSMVSGFTSKENESADMNTNDAIAHYLGNISKLIGNYDESENMLLSNFVRELPNSMIKTIVNELIYQEIIECYIQTKEDEGLLIPTIYVKLDGSEDEYEILHESVIRAKEISTPAEIIGDDKIFNSYTNYSAKITNIADLFASKEKNKVLVIVNENGDYLVNSKGSLVVIDIVDDRSVSNIAIVAKNWLDEKLKFIRDLKDKDEAESSVDEDAETVTVYKDPEEKDFSTGAFPPNLAVQVGVNGVVAEEV